eukprot:3588716-Prorocentrum_lima.AAC.1
MKQRYHGPGIRNISIATTLHHLGLLRRAVRDHVSAQRLLQQSLGIKRHAYGLHAKNTDIAQTLDSL